VLSEGGKINQETRLWNLDRGETAVMRSKEEAHDYRYFPDPDLLPLKLEKEWIEGFRSSLPELPAARASRFVSEYGLPEYDAGVLTTDKDLANFFEVTVKAQLPASKEDQNKMEHMFGVAVSDSPREIAKETSNWVTVELLGLLNKGNTKAESKPKSLTIRESPVTPQMLAGALLLKRTGKISGPVAKMVLEVMFETRKEAKEIVEDKGLIQVSDESELAKIIDEVLEKSPAQVAQFKEGKQQVLGFLVGQVMKASGGKANPGKVNELLKRKLA
jgi:aspartyl-tRNA(Asn)/glutamyl-tRNA(Gln) amidotransferase subunit B